MIMSCMLIYSAACMGAVRWLCVVSISPQCVVFQQAITARGLDQYYHLEEDCLVKKADVSKLLQRIQVLPPQHLPPLLLLASIH